MDKIQAIIDEYFDKHPIDIEQVKINYKSRNHFKVLDDANDDIYDFGVNSAKLYIKN